MAYDKVLELYHQNRTFGFYLIRLISQRLLDDYATLRDTALAARHGAAPGSAGNVGSPSQEAIRSGRLHE